MTQATHHSQSKASARPGDNTVVLMDMCNTCLDNGEYAASVFVGISVSVLPKEYRQQVKRVTPTIGVHAGLASQSGLKLGMTRAEAEAVRGPPHPPAHKGVEFGVKAAGEVSKDVWGQVGEGGGLGPRGSPRRHPARLTPP